MIVNWHGFHPAGGLMLGVSFNYPVSIYSPATNITKKRILIKVHLIVVTFGFHIDYGQKTGKITRT
jgi:hypothetical protein